MQAIEEADVGARGEVAAKVMGREERVGAHLIQQRAGPPSGHVRGQLEVDVDADGVAGKSRQGTAGMGANLEIRTWRQVLVEQRKKPLIENPEMCRRRRNGNLVRRARGLLGHHR
jgi:hypothetical protein